MKRVWKKGAALALAAVMCAGALSGCGKDAEGISAFTYNGKKVDADFTNFALRYEQSKVDDLYAYYGSMMQQDIWSMDDGQGLGISTWDNFKTNIGEDIEKMLLAEDHAADYDVSLTDDEKKAITDAAAQFIANNDEKALASMSATQETVERYLTLCAIKAKVEVGMTADVDTNVSDEEAAQRTVDYIRYTPTTEAQTETESEMSETEADVENTVQTEADVQALTEGETSVVETEASSKTKSSDTEKAETEPAQAETEAAQAPEETESEDPAMAEAKAKYREMAQEKLDEITSGKTDFEAAAAAVTDEAVPGVTNSSFTFGKDDDYPDAAIIEATNDLEDGAVVDHLVEASDSYYILCVKAAFDEDATEDKKEEIVRQRKQDKIDEIYEGWMADTKFETNTEKLAAILKDRSYSAPASDETEAVASTEAETGRLGPASLETELHLEVTYETEITVETETEEE